MLTYSTSDSVYCHYPYWPGLGQTKSWGTSSESLSSALVPDSLIDAPFLFQPLGLWLEIHPWTLVQPSVRTLSP